jgi:hypothetical protein
VGLILSQSLEKSAMFMLLLGICFPGKQVVGLNYLLEFIPEKQHIQYVTAGMICECLTILAISRGYETVSRHWLWLQLYGVLGTFISLLIHMFFIPESPKFLYLAKRYKESK